LKFLRIKFEIQSILDIKKRIATVLIFCENRGKQLSKDLKTLESLKALESLQALESLKVPFQILGHKTLKSSSHLTKLVSRYSIVLQEAMKIENAQKA
jgi:hypothetical protein